MAWERHVSASCVALENGSHPAEEVRKQRSPLATPQSLHSGPRSLGVPPAHASCPDDHIHQCVPSFVGGLRKTGRIIRCLVRHQGLDGNLPSQDLESLLDFKFSSQLNLRT